MLITNISDLYKSIPEQNQPMESQSLGSTFKYYNIFVPGSSAIGVALLINLQHIDNINFTAENTVNPEYIYRLAEITETTYNDLNITTKFYHGTSSNVAVMDLNDLYVSLVT